MRFIAFVIQWVNIAFMCETVGCLPNPGGLFQQHPDDVKRLEQVFKAKKQYEVDQHDKRDPRRKSETDEPGPVMPTRKR